MKRQTKLFEEAVLAPFNTFVSEYIVDWAARPRGAKSAYIETREFYRGVYDVLSANRRLIHEMIGGRATGALPADTVSTPQLGGLLERFEEIIERESGERGFRHFDPAVMTRLMFGLVFSVAVHGDWMFEGATRPRPSVEAFIDEMASLTIYGAYSEDARPAAAPCPAPGVHGIGEHRREPVGAAEADTSTTHFSNVQGTLDSRIR